MEQYKFFIKDLRDDSIWGITEIEPDENRQGWLNGKCILVGNNEKNYVGADIGIDAEYVFTSGNFDYGKELDKTIKLTP